MGRPAVRGAPLKRHRTLLSPARGGAIYNRLPADQGCRFGKCDRREMDATRHPSGYHGNKNARTKALGQPMTETLQDRLRERLAEACGGLADEGKLLRTGFTAMLRGGAPLVTTDMPEEDVRRLRYAFLAGCETMFCALTAVLDPKRERTDVDIQRIDNIIKELRAAREEMTTTGSAPPRSARPGRS